MERRFFSGIEVRETAEGRFIEGYGSVFYNPADPGTQYQLRPGLLERVAPSAFNRAIAEQQDVRGLFNHDTNFVLGRTKAGTMTLVVDNVGLWYSILLPHNTLGRDIAASIQRGDITGSSFSFRVLKHSHAKGDKVDIRTIEDVDLFDVGPVVFPAYGSATAGMRSAELAAIEKEWEAWKLAQDMEAERVRVRARCVELGT